MKPTWNEAPEDATHRAQDDDGEWYFYKNAPSPGLNFWWPRGKSWFASKDQPNPNWRTTLEARPKGEK